MMVQNVVWSTPRKSGIASSGAPKAVPPNESSSQERDLRKAEIFINNRTSTSAEAPSWCGAELYRQV